VQQPTRYQAAVRTLVGCLTGWAVLALLLRIGSGHWPRSGIQFTFPVAIVLVTLIRLSIAYWEARDAEPDR
jgi:hypothetical protein